MSFDWSLLLVIFEVAIGLGMVIFVHELGHFAVAKLCGVKCEKFYLGFDIAGLKLFKFTRGETEYGIGILPLGGYVKMLGQEDNPARLREEIERAKRKAAEADAPSEAATEPDAPEKTDDGEDASEGEKNTKKDEKKPVEPPIDIAAAEQALFDPRSYLAQSVPKRMAIISAGVIMNVIFAFICAVIAYKMGVKQLRCGVSGIAPGSGAYKAGIRVGDVPEKIGDRNIERFGDLKAEISVGDNDDGAAVVVRRADGSYPDIPPVKLDHHGLAPTIGILAPHTNELTSGERVVMPGSPAAAAEPGFEPADKLIAVARIDEDGTAVDREVVESYVQYHSYLARHPHDRLAITVERSAGIEGNGTESGGAESDGTETEEVTVEVARNPMKRLGLIMEMGQICAIQADAPEAVREGIQLGDRILRFTTEPPQPAETDSDGEAADEGPLDPMTFPEQLRKEAAKHAEARVWLVIERDGEELGAPIEVPLRHTDWYEYPIDESQPVSAPALGLAYLVDNRVAAVIPDTPAAVHGRIKPGDKIVEVTLVPPDKETLEKYDSKQEEWTLVFDDEKQNWPFLITVLQSRVPGTRVKLKSVSEGDEYKVNVTAELTPYDAEGWSVEERGLILQPDIFLQTGDTWADAVRLGAKETRESLLLVLKFLRKIGTQISPKAVGGPVAIATWAGRAAQEGPSQLLIFLCIISANLAVINFLPIPVLDGGHMVFLAWEGIRGKPADERVQALLTYIGLIMILALMVWVIGLDVGLIPR